MDIIGNSIGHLFMKTDGAILQSGGDLENDEKSASIIMGIINLTESVDDKFIPNGGCERISIVYEDHVYNICMSNRLIYVLKLKKVDQSGTMRSLNTAGVENPRGNVIT